MLSYTYNYVRDGPDRLHAMHTLATCTRLENNITFRVGPNGDKQNINPAFGPPAMRWHWSCVD